MTDETIVCPSCTVLNRVPHARLAEQPKCGRCGQPLFTGKPLAVDTALFDRLVTRGTLPVLVDFWASWCAPCRAMAPAFAAAAPRLEPRMVLAKVDTEAEPGLAERFQIRSIPTLLLVRGGREIDRRAGALPEAAILEWAGRAAGG